jgi:hypothetical protein
MSEDAYMALASDHIALVEEARALKAENERLQTGVMEAEVHGELIVRMRESVWLESEAERDRLRAVVRRAQETWKRHVENYYDDDAHNDWMAAWDALRTLDVGPALSDQPLLCDNCGQTLPEHLRPSGLLTCRPEAADVEEDWRT